MNKERYEVLKKEELKRTVIEEYSSKMMKLKYNLPVLVGLVMLLGWFVLVLIDKESIMNQFGFYPVYIGFIMMLPVFLFDIQEEWKEKLKIKDELSKENEGLRKLYSEVYYDENKVYFDSRIVKSLFDITRFISLYASLLVYAIIIFWIVSRIIQLPPTTIIIFLLVMILINQYKNR